MPKPGTRALMKMLLAVLMSLLSFLTGCAGGCEPVALTAVERAWLAPYHEGQVLHFRSNRGATNTLTVMKPQEWLENQNCNRLEAGPYQPIFSQVVLRPATGYAAQYPDFVVNLRKSNPKRPAHLTLSASGLECGTAAVPGQVTSQLQPQPCTLANGQHYAGAFVFRDGQNAHRLGNSRLRAFYWDAQAGLIRYELADGEVFDLVAVP